METITQTLSPDTTMVPMRDGVKLYTEITKPEDAGTIKPYPVVLIRGYWPGYAPDAERFNEAGYIYVGQSTRGHGKSEGADGESRRFFDDTATLENYTLHLHDARPIFTTSRSRPHAGTCS